MSRGEGHPRYGSTWAPWRTVGPDVPSTTHTLTLEEGETIAEVSGFSRVPGRGSEHPHMAGWTESPGAATAAGRAATPPPSPRG